MALDIDMLAAFENRWKVAWTCGVTEMVRRTLSEVGVEVMMHSAPLCTRIQTALLLGHGIDSARSAIQHRAEPPGTAETVLCGLISDKAQPGEYTLELSALRAAQRRQASRVLRAKPQLLAEPENGDLLRPYPKRWSYRRGRHEGP